MPKKNRENAPHGFTLVEILVALLITSILTVAIYNFFIGQHHAYTVQDQVIEMEQNARAAMDMIRRELRMAGYHAMGKELLDNMSSFVSSDILPDSPILVTLGNRSIKISKGSGSDPDMITFLTVLPEHNNMATLDNESEVGDPDITLKAGESEKFLAGDMIHIGSCSEYAKVTGITGEKLIIDVISADKKLSQKHKANTPVSKISVVSYALITEADGTPVLKRKARDNSSYDIGFQPVAENITDMKFEREDTTGEILLTLASQTARPDHKFQFNNGYRTYTAGTRIMARNAGVAGVDLGTDCPLPDAPAAVSLIGLNETNPCEISITWDSVTVSEEDCEVTGYKVFYGTSPGFYVGSVEVGKETTYAPLDVTGLTACIYYISVAALNSAGTGAKSEIQSITDFFAPVTPTGFSVENINGVERKTLLSWDKNSECDLQGYNIEKKKLESDTGFDPISNSIISKDLDTYTDIAFGTPDAIDCAIYSYRIQAADYCLTSAWSTEEPAGPTAPAPPTGPIFSSTATDTLSWTLSTDDFDVNGLNYIAGYRVYIPPENSLPVDTLDPGTTTWTSTSLNPYYDVSAFDACDKESKKLQFSSACIDTVTQIAITDPSENETFSGTVTIKGTATATSGRTISKVRLQIDSSSWVDLSGTDAWSYQWNTTAEQEGSHTITVGAYDNLDCYSQVTITVTVSNPEVVIQDLQCKLYGCQNTDGYVYLLAYVYDKVETDPISGATIKVDIDVGPSFQELLPADEFGYYGGDALAPCTMKTDAGTTTDKNGISTRSQQKPRSGTITATVMRSQKVTTCSWENPD